MLITKKPVQTAMRLLMLCCLSIPVLAQTYTLSGKVSDVSAHPVASATVTAKSLATGKVFRAQTNSDGMYSIVDLSAGDYDVSAVAGELQAPAVKVTLAAAQTTDLTVSPAIGTKRKHADAQPDYVVR